MKLKIWKTLVMNIILMIIFISIIITVNLKMNIMEIDLNYFILPIFCAVLFGCIITYLSMKRRKREISYEKRYRSEGCRDNVLIFKLWVIVL